MKNQLLILGAGGHGKSVAEAALLSQRYEQISFLDDRWPEQKKAIGFNIISSINGIKDLDPKNIEAIAAVGNNKIREEWTSLLIRYEFQLATIIHPHASVSEYAKIGQGTAIMALAIVGADASVGRGCIINPNATLDHDSTLGDFGHLGVGVQIAGGVKIGERAWLQAGSCAGYHVIIPPNEHYPAGSIFRA